MSSELNLPFGRTQITVNEYSQLVETERAEKLLVANGVDNPAERVERFVGECPKMLEWLESHGRHFSWRNTVDPWRVYATEILLQRTRADAVEEIYEDFFEEFPTPEELHNSDEDTVRDLVRSLGFVNHRTRSLSEAAAMCVDKYGGNVPESLDALKEPWRVGDYSARACLIFSFGQSQPLVDSNFARVVERLFNYEMPSQPHKSDTVYELLGALVPNKPSIARAFNFAILDIGALVCTPDSPSCDECPLQEGCDFGREEVDI